MASFANPDVDKKSWKTPPQSRSMLKVLKPLVFIAKLTLAAPAKYSPNQNASDRTSEDQDNSTNNTCRLQAEMQSCYQDLHCIPGIAHKDT